MASSKVARRRQSSLPKEPPASVDISDSDGEKDSGLDDFEIIKTIGKSDLHVLCCRVIVFGVMRVISFSFSGQFTNERACKLSVGLAHSVTDIHTNSYDVTGPKFSILTFFVYTSPVFLETLFSGSVMLGVIPKVEI